MKSTLKPYQEGTADDHRHATAMAEQLHRYLHLHKQAIRAHDEGTARVYLASIRAMTRPCFAEALTDFITHEPRHIDPWLDAPLKIGLLGAAEFLDESRKIFGVFVTEHGHLFGCPLETLFDPIDRGKGTECRRGRRIQKFVDATPGEILERYQPLDRFSSGLYRHFKSTDPNPKHYAALGRVTVIASGTECILYCALYKPHAGIMALRPAHGHDGFYTPVAKRKVEGLAQPYSGKRFSLVGEPIPPAKAWRDIVEPCLQKAA